MTNGNERWKTDGDCSKCRRKLYCGKDCKAAVKRFETLCKEFLYERTSIYHVKNHIQKETNNDNCML